MPCGFYSLVAGYALTAKLRFPSVVDAIDEARLRERGRFRTWFRFG